jgi:hypothetical protein
VTPEQARALYIDYCTVGGMEQYGEKAAVAAIMPLATALMEVLAAVRAHLPPDGISVSHFVERVVEAVDNPDINPMIAVLERPL